MNEFTSDIIKNIYDVISKLEQRPQIAKKIKVTHELWKQILDECPPIISQPSVKAEFYGIPIVVDNNITEPYEVIYQEECERCKVCKSFDSCTNAVKDGTAVRCVLFGELKRYIEKENVQ